ncbi:MAG: sulfatase [Saprospiraceae bacterium]|nr:sulfatase [Saprospiraceae bacterium]
MHKSFPHTLQLAICLLPFFFPSCQPKVDQEPIQPNILFAISDDQSYPYVGIYGAQELLTPASDGVAKRGVRFTNAFCAAPQCSPSRAAILTGLNIWQLEEAGTHSSYFPRKFPVFTQHLAQTGYQLGYTGKPWGPGNWKDAGWPENPVGPAFNEITYDSVPYTGINKRNYAANFEAFLTQRPANTPFFFWYGCHEPHRDFEAGSGRKAGKKITKADVPQFLPGDSVIRDDILDYNLEIEWFDQHLGKMLALLEAKGELENTIVIITSDNGMAFPYAKANLQEYGTHVPLIMAGPGIVPGEERAQLVSLIDLAPTLLEMAGAAPLPDISGISMHSLLSVPASDALPVHREYVLTGRERHTHARPDNFGYPARAIRTTDFLYIHNFDPARWPLGDPEVEFPADHVSPTGFKSMVGGFHDIDPSPSKSFIQDHAEDLPFFYNLAVAKRPKDQLYFIERDPACIEDLSEHPNFLTKREELRAMLFVALEEQMDPRVLGHGEIFESYPRFAGMREFPGFQERGKYNPKYGKAQLNEK